MSSTLFTAAIILGALFSFIMLFVLIHRNSNNKKTAKRKAIFADTTWKNKLEINEKESINNYMLAIDTTNFVLLYINFSEPQEKITLIDLWQIKTVKVITEYDSVFEHRKGASTMVDKQISRLQLEILLTDNDEKLNLVLLEYKDGLHDFLKIKQRAEYWGNLLNTSLQQLPQAIGKW